VAVDELGRPVTPRWYSDRFQALAREAGVPAIRLHDARHGYGSHLLHQGVPVPIVAQVMGHATPAVTMAVYAHALRGGTDERVRAATSAAGL
jgi:integrase